MFGQRTSENGEVSSANSFAYEITFSGKLFMYTRKRRGPSIDPCGTSALTSSTQMTGYIAQPFDICYFEKI